MTSSLPPAADRPRPTDRAASTRAALIELAADVFAEQGYFQTSIRDIARRGKVTTGAIYGHFRNKADLLAEAINARTAQELEAQTMGLTDRPDYVQTLTRLGREYPKRRRLRALIVQGAAAALTDNETRTQLRDEQLAHIQPWIDGYQRDRAALGIDPAVDIPTAVLATWALELGLGVLESVGIEPPSEAWSDIQNRLARSLQLPPAGHDRRRTAPAKPPTRKTPGR